MSENKAELECKGGFQATSLMKAALHNDRAGIVIALECTATNIDAVNHLGSTALMIACSKGHMDVVNCLIAAGADLSITDGEGNGAYEIAKMNDHHQVATTVANEKAKRDALWAAITGAPTAPKPPSDKKDDDALAALLMGAGATLPTLSREAPF